MSNETGLRINSRIEKDIIPFLVRNHLWDDKENKPSKSMITLGWVESIEDIHQRVYNNGKIETKFYWHFTEHGKDSICTLLKNIY